MITPEAFQLLLIFFISQTNKRFFFLPLFIVEIKRHTHIYFHSGIVLYHLTHFYLEARACKYQIALSAVILFFQFVSRMK